MNQEREREREKRKRNNRRTSFERKYGNEGGNAKIKQSGGY